MWVCRSMFGGLIANRSRRIVVFLTLVCLLLTVQILTQKTKSETIVVETTNSPRLLLEVKSQSQEVEEPSPPQNETSTRDNKILDIKAMQQTKVKNEILKNLSTLDSKQLQKLWRLLDSTRDPHAVHKIRIENALQALKVHLLEEVSGQKYPDIMEAAYNGRAISEEARPKPLQIVISTTWRSGSTFLEELLSSHPAVYNHYEPLMHFGLRQIRDGEDSVKAQQLIHDLLKCSYVGQDTYIKTAMKIPDMFSRNAALWHSCNSEDLGNSMCYNEAYLEAACQLFPWAIMKLVRIRLRLLRPVLEDKNLNIRIVYLVRDPRGVINSRTGTVKWCSSADCNDPRYLCSDMDDDLTAAIRLKKEFPGKVYILRYEDLALSPFNKTEELLKYVGLDFDPKMQKFLLSHTTKDFDAPWSTSRESKKRVTYWVPKLAIGKLKTVQEVCSPVMKRFGYLPINSTTGVKVSHILEPLVLPES